MMNFRDTSFDPHQTDMLFLSGQVDLAGFSFAVTDSLSSPKALRKRTYKKAILSADDWAKELETLFEEEPLLQKNYASSTWSFLSNKATLLPEAFVQPEQLRTCLAYAVELDELDEVHYYALPKEQAFSVFAMPSPPVNVILKYQRKARFLHQQAQLISQARRLTGYDRALLHLSASLADVTLYKNGKLVLCNTYPIHAFTDALYHLLFAVKQHQLRPTNVFLYYMGPVGEADHQLLTRYFKHVKEVYNQPASQLIGQPEATAYHSLLTLAQCE
jgi:hypothetical protein